MAFHSMLATVKFNKLTEVKLAITALIECSTFAEQDVGGFRHIMNSCTVKNVV